MENIADNDAHRRPSRSSIKLHTGKVLASTPSRPSFPDNNTKTRYRRDKILFFSSHFLPFFTISSPESSCLPRLPPLIRPVSLKSTAPACLTLPDPTQPYFLHALATHLHQLFRLSLSQSSGHPHHHLPLISISHIRMDYIFWFLDWLRNVTVPYHDSREDSFPKHLTFTCAVTDSKGPRRFMEDAHSIVVPYAGVRGQGFFAIFDGHAGKQAAEWCGQNFSLVRLSICSCCFLCICN